jgi:tripartite-type tricarboxylate transporter receptor subunit TctC
MEGAGAVACQTVANSVPDVQQRLTEGGNVATPSSPDEMRAKIAAELARWSRVIEAGNIKME